MGLRERRTLDAYRDGAFAQWQARIADVVGYDVPVEVAWEQLAAQESADLATDTLDRVYFQGLVGALESVCRDELGREAVRGKLVRIVIENSGKHFGSSGFTFVDGVLRIDHKITNAHAVADRTKQLTKLIESNL